MKIFGLAFLLTLYCANSFADSPEDALEYEILPLSSAGVSPTDQVEIELTEDSELIAESGEQAEDQNLDEIQTESIATPKQVTITKGIELKSFERVVTDESMANRQGKSFTINATLFGISFGSPASALEVGHHFSSDSILSLSFHDLKGFEIADEENRNDYVFNGDGKGRAISISFKKFISNSFYMKPAIYHRNQRQIQSGITAFDSASESWVVTSRESSTYTDMGASFSVGNQWQWDTFTVGCDWIGITKSFSTIELEGDLPQSALDSINALSFYMGATF